MKTRLDQKSVSRPRRSRPIPALKSGSGVKVEESVIINRPPEAIFSFWRQLENLPRFMQHIESVTQTSPELSHWVVKSDKGKTLQWDAQIIEEKPGTMIAWESLPGADVANAGSVWFTPAPDGRGTVVKVELKYAPPGGKVGLAIAKFLGEDADEQIAFDLDRLKT